MTDFDEIDESLRPRDSLRGALRSASSPAGIDARRDQTIRESIRAHHGFRRVADSGAAPSQLSLPRRSVRALVRSRPRLATAAFAAAALVAIGVVAFMAQVMLQRSHVTGGAASAQLTPSSPSVGGRVDTDLASAVRAARTGGGDARVAALLAAIVASGLGADGSASAGGAEREPGPRFVAVDLFIDAPSGVDGAVFDVAVDDPHGVLVGIGSGDAPFAEPPTYDAKRLATGAIRLATIPVSRATGRVRVATLSIRADAASPMVTITPVSAVTDSAGDSTPVTVTWTATLRSTP